MRPRACVLWTDGVNCDLETEHALALAGADAQRVHVNELHSGARKLNEFALLALPGGFSYGDDVASGKILTVELLAALREQLEDFVADGRVVVGICNGFQVLVRTGLLPFRRLGAMDVTLLPNASGRFECRWVTVRVEPSPSVFTRGLEGAEIDLPVAHGEGRLFAPPETVAALRRDRLVPLRYARAGAPSQEHPYNPNGSVDAVAALCDPTGRVLGLMPHPERFVRRAQHPDRRRAGAGPLGLELLRNAVAAAGEA